MLNRFKLIAFLLSGFSLMMISCTSTILEESDTTEKVPISFSVPQIVTRAAVNNVNDLSDFRVWGWRRVSIDATEYFSVFDGEKVTKDSGWNYEGGIRYWNKGEFYNFYAVHPADVLDICTVSDGVIKIDNYNATNNYDLMTATSPTMIYTDQETPPTSVPLEFKHIMVNLLFVARTAPSVADNGVEMTITSFKLTGFPVTGSYNSSSIPAWSVSTPQNERYNSTTEIPLGSDTAYKDVVNLIVFPQSLGTVQGSSLRYEITYRDNNGNEYEDSGNFSQISGDLSSWIEGKGYRYSMDLGGNYILFGTPEVEQWDEMSGGRWNVE